MKLKHGMRVTAEIHGYKVEDAKVSIEDGWYYLNQNDFDNTSCNPFFGYKFKLPLNTNEQDAIKDYKIKPVTENIEDNLWVGAIITNGSTRKVLGICGEIIHLSYHNDFDQTYSCTFNSLKKYGYKLDLKASGVEEEQAKEKTITIDGKEWSKSTA